MTHDKQFFERFLINLLGFAISSMASKYGFAGMAAIGFAISSIEVLQISST